MPATIGALTAGGDSPGLNAAIRAVGKAAGQTKGVPIDHPWIETARHLGVALGD